MKTSTQRFPYRSARSGGLLAGIVLVLVSEGLGLHLWLYSRKPWLAWILTATTLSAIWWLAADYRALGTGAIEVDDDSVHFRVGKRYDFRIPRDSIASVIVPTWREIPETGTPAAGDYVNLMKQADPNVLLTLGAPTEIRAPGRKRTVSRIALHLDDPNSFLQAVSQVLIAG